MARSKQAQSASRGGRASRPKTAQNRNPGSNRETAARQQAIQRPVTNGNHRPIRYAVVGAGHIAQNAVLPAFRNTRGACELTALFSGDSRKRRELARIYGLRHVFDYDEFDDACRADLFDAVYIALPNSLHCEYTCRAAEAGIHVLCEKPLATTVAECRQMIDAAAASDVRLMTAYRLHFEPANLRAIQIARSGRLGQLRLFNSVFTMQVRDRNIRLESELGGGPLYDLGIYCINAARYLFDDEPVEVVAQRADGNDERFDEVEEALAGILRFPDDRIASFICGFGSADASYYHLLGTRGDLCVDPAYEYEGRLAHTLTVGGKTSRTVFRKGDQFAPELIYFADCIRNGVDPEPSGEEGLIDVAIIRALHRSASTGEAVRLGRMPRDASPTPQQEIRRRPPRKPALVNADSAHIEE